MITVATDERGKAPDAFSGSSPLRKTGDTAFSQAKVPVSAMNFEPTPTNIYRRLPDISREFLLGRARMRGIDAKDDYGRKLEYISRLIEKGLKISDVLRMSAENAGNAAAFHEAFVALVDRLEVEKREPLALGGMDDGRIGRELESQEEFTKRVYTQKESVKVLFGEHTLTFSFDNGGRVKIKLEGKNRELFLQREWNYAVGDQIHITTDQYLAGPGARLIVLRGRERSTLLQDNGRGSQALGMTVLPDFTLSAEKVLKDVSPGVREVDESVVRFNIKNQAKEKVLVSIIGSQLRPADRSAARSAPKLNVERTAMPIYNLLTPNLRSFLARRAKDHKEIYGSGIKELAQKYIRYVLLPKGLTFAQVRELRAQYADNNENFEIAFKTLVIGLTSAVSSAIANDPYFLAAILEGTGVKYLAFSRSMEVEDNKKFEGALEAFKGFRGREKLKENIVNFALMKAKAARSVFNTEREAELVRAVDGFLFDLQYNIERLSSSSGALSGVGKGSPLGGIDFDSSKLKLQIKRDGKGVPLPLPQQDIENINIEGLFPVIINIQPVNLQTLPVLGQVQDEHDIALSQN